MVPLKTHPISSKTINLLTTFIEVTFFIKKEILLVHKKRFTQPGRHISQMNIVTLCLLNWESDQGSISVSVSLR